MKIAILYGTETGNAEMLAEDIASHLSAHDTSVTNLKDVNPGDLVAGTLHIFVCSTYGDGELPASAKPFAERMDAAPDLGGVLFAVFGMGDSEYPETFNFGGKRMEALMSQAGATMLGERVTHDASGGDLPEDLALPWAETVVGLAESVLATAD
ncbi:MAG: flavodoxin domain-containing protein [Rhizobiaceae bacterium]